jgi:hypothetical protein
MTGASPSMVKTFGSARRSAVALSMMYSACFSLICRSREKWTLRNSTSGFPSSVFEKNTSSVGIVMAGACTAAPIPADPRATSYLCHKNREWETYQSKRYKMWVSEGCVGPRVTDMALLMSSCRSRVSFELGQRSFGRSHHLLRTNIFHIHAPRDALLLRQHTQTSCPYLR